jgi:hypothetical protein
VSLARASAMLVGSLTAAVKCSAGFTPNLVKKRDEKNRRKERKWKRVSVRNVVPTLTSSKR